MAAKSINNLIKQLASADDYEEFLSSCSEEQLSSFNNVLEAHCNEFLGYLKAQKEKAQNKMVEKIQVAFSEDPEMAKVLSRIIKGEFDNSKVLCLGVQIALMDQNECAEEQSEDMPPLEDDSGEEEQQAEDQSSDEVQENAGESQ